MMREEVYRTVKNIQHEEHMAPGNPLCAGCGGLLAVRLFHKALGSNVVWVNAAGCMTMLSLYPYSPIPPFPHSPIPPFPHSPIQSSWLYTAFASAPAGAQGVRDALDVLIRKGRISGKEDLKVVVVTGDGAAFGIGLRSTLGAIQRNLDFYYLRYGNEAYGNSVFQMLSSTPFGSSSATTEPTPLFPEGNSGRKRDLFEIWKAQKPSCLATESAFRTVDFLQKVEKSTHINGPNCSYHRLAAPRAVGTTRRKQFASRSLE